MLLYFNTSDEARTVIDNLRNHIHLHGYVTMFDLQNFTSGQHGSDDKTKGWTDADDFKLAFNDKNNQYSILFLSNPKQITNLVLYLCNGENADCPKTHCALRDPNGDCKHTTNEKYAKNPVEKRKFKQRKQKFGGYLYEEE